MKCGLVKIEKTGKRRVETKFWGLKVGKEMVGEAGLRMGKSEAGDVVYKIYPEYRGRGYGNLILRLLKKKAEKLGLEELIVMCRKDNLASKRVIENNGGVFLREIKRRNGKIRLAYKISY